MNRKNLFIVILAVALFLLLGSGISLWAESIFSGNIEIKYYQNTIDLRPEYNMNRSDDGKSSGSCSVDNLQIGSVFISPSGAIRKVTDIYDSNGSIVIETSEPEFDEAFDTLDIPDFEISIENEDFCELGEGITLLTEEESKDPSNYLCSEFEEGSKLKFDKNVNIGHTFNIKKTLYKSKSDRSLVEGLQKKVPKGSTYKVDNSIKVELIGTLQANLHIHGYYHSWWKKLKRHKSATVEITVSQDIDVKVIGTGNLSETYSIFIGKFKNGLFTGNLYADVSVFGKVSLTVRLEESTSLKFGMKNNNGKHTKIWSPTYDIGFKPELSANATVKVGPKLVGKLKFMKISLASATLKTGLGVKVTGFIGAIEKIGRTQNGAYGDISRWFVDATAKLFVYANASVKILKKSFTVYSHSWTLKKWGASTWL